MVGVVNPVCCFRVVNRILLISRQNATETVEIQRAFAENATISFSPGENFPAEVASTTSATSSSTASSTASSTSSPTATGAVTTPTSSAAAAAVTDKSTLSNGAIAGIAIGGAAVILLAAALLYLCGRQRTMGEMIRQNQHPLP